MAYLRIHCGYCGGTWDVYHKQRELDPARICPHCEQRIDRRTWQEQVLPAYNSLRGANMELMNDHVQYHTPRFEVDFIADGEFQNAHSGAQEAELNNLREDVTDVQNALRKLFDTLERGEHD